MRYLRLYKNDTDFKTHEQEAGGTGNEVESVVPGIVKTLDERKMYFNPHDKEIRFHTLTINYKKRYGDSLAPSTTKSIKYIPSVEQEIVVTPENIEGYTPVESKKAVSIPTDSVVDFIYSPVLDPSKPLTLNIISAGTIVWKAQNTAYTTTIEYSTDNGETWTSITSNTEASAPSISVNAGDVVQFRGDNVTYASGYSYYNTFNGSTAKFEVEGNIMSLIDSENYANKITLVSSYTFSFLFMNCIGLTYADGLVLPATTLVDYCYHNMFQGCTDLKETPKLHATTLASGCYEGMFSGCRSLTTALELPATTLALSCYGNMFYGCTSLTTAQELPARKLSQNCYADMFNGCTSLITAPELPATTLADGCYNRMFTGCKSLTEAPDLPATTLAQFCYNSMFEGCTSLAKAPALPATALDVYCYYYMFKNCTSLTTAPELPATRLVLGCYYRMFYGCTSLNYIKSLATNILASECTSNWVDGVSSTGTFVKDASMTGWTRGINGIPNGWTVQNV